MDRIISYFLKSIATRTGTILTEATFNLDKQPVKMEGRSRTKVVKRTVYRIDIDDEADELVGSILLKGEWNRVVFDEKARYWRIHNA